MVEVSDLADSLRQVLFDNWNLKGSLSRENIGFNTGVAAPSRKYPSIEILPISEPSSVLTLEWWDEQPVCFIHVWMRPKSTEERNLQTAKSSRSYMVQEVNRILHKNQCFIKDFDFIQPETTWIADQYHAIETGERSQTRARASSESYDESMVFPILHTVIPIRGRRFHGATYGGYARNR